MAKLTAADRKGTPTGQFGLPSKAKTSSAKAKSGNYPMPDKQHAAVAKSYAARYASPSQRKQIDAKANKILGKSSKTAAKGKSRGK